MENKTSSKKSSKKSSTRVEGVDYEINANVTLTCYNWGKRQTAKLTIANAFVIFATIMENEAGEYFLSYPSYKNKEGEFKKSAYCFDKEIITEITESINDFMEE